MVAHVKSSKYKLRYMYEYLTPKCQIKSALEQSFNRIPAWKWDGCRQGPNLLVDNES